MKVFEVPHVEVVRFSRNDIVVCSCQKNCNCVDCTVCPPGSNDCQNYDFKISTNLTGLIIE